MSEDRQGFEIYGKFFPFVAYPDWLNSDFGLARALTGVATEDLFGDPILFQQALVAVAVAHESPEMSRADVVTWVGGLKPEDAKEIGFEQVERPSPLPAAAPSASGDSSSRSSDEPSEPNPET